MKFLKDIRLKLGISGAEFGRVLGLPKGQERQGYRSLLNANDRIKLEILVALREVSGLSDTELLDAIEKEVKNSRKLGAGKVTTNRLKKTAP